MAKEVHKKRAVGMKSFVLKHKQFHVAQSKQVTSMHFKMNKVDEMVTQSLRHPRWKAMLQKAIRSGRDGLGNLIGKRVLLVCLR